MKPAHNIAGSGSMNTVLNGPFRRRDTLQVSSLLGCPHQLFSTNSSPCLSDLDGREVHVFANVGGCIKCAVCAPVFTFQHLIHTLLERDISYHSTPSSHVLSNTFTTTTTPTLSCIQLHPNIMKAHSFSLLAFLLSGSHVYAQSVGSCSNITTEGGWQGVASISVSPTSHPMQYLCPLRLTSKPVLRLHGYSLQLRPRQRRRRKLARQHRRRPRHWSGLLLWRRQPDTLQRQHGQRSAQLRYRVRVLLRAPNHRRGCIQQRHWSRFKYHGHGSRCMLQ